MEEVKALPNPNGVWITKDVHVTRQQCVKECQKCRNMFSDENIGDVCIPYADPKSKWRNYRREDFGGHDLVLNPCPMATHMKHTPKSAFFNSKGKLNPIKQSKRG